MHNTLMYVLMITCKAMRAPPPHPPPPPPLSISPSVSLGVEVGTVGLIFFLLRSLAAID